MGFVMVVLDFAHLRSDRYVKNRRQGPCMALIYIERVNLCTVQLVLPGPRVENSIPTS